MSGDDIVGSFTLPHLESFYVRDSALLEESADASQLQAVRAAFSGQLLATSARAEFGGAAQPPPKTQQGWV